MGFEVKVLSWKKVDKELLYSLLAARIEVFVIEQNCPYQEADGKDQNSTHVFVVNTNKEIMAYARIVHPGISYKEVSIGRVMTAQNHRDKGLGKELMNASLKAIEEQFGKVDVRISAQEYLLKFYQSLGFDQVSEVYLEDDIPHIEMLKSTW